MMSFFEDLKRDRDKQIMALSIVFFVLAFPTYFYLAASNSDGSSGLNSVEMYVIDGELTYIELDAGDEFVADGDPLVIDDLHTDSIDNAEDLNIVGVVLTMSYTEAEETSGVFGNAGCQGPTSGQTTADTITGMTMHGEYNETASGSNGGESGSHSVESWWVNISMFEEVVLMSKADIISEIDADGAGLGAYSAEISVDAEASGTETCQRSDAGEDVTYTIELIVLEYDIKPLVFFEEL